MTRSPLTPRGPLHRTNAVLLALLLPLALLTVVGLVLLRPDGSAPTPYTVDQAEYPTASVTAVTTESCAGTNENRLPDGSIPESVQCTRVTAVLTGSDRAGTEVKVWTPGTVVAEDVPVGTDLVLVHYPAVGTDTEVFGWYDYDRGSPLAVLAVAFAGAVVLVAGLRGLRALAGLAIAFGVIGAWILPAVIQGRDAPLVGLVGSAAIMFVVLPLAHGFTHRTTTALLGTLAGLAVTGALGAAAASAAHLTGISTEQSYQLTLVLDGQDGRTLSGIFVCGVVLAGLGVLNDVTITQASALWELRAADPTASRRQLFAGGMRIGRDHIASTVYTIAFAYTGAALPVLLLVQVYRFPLLQTLTSGEFAEEIARTAVSSIGLALAIPITTAIGAVVVTSIPAQRLRGGRHSATVAPAHSHGA
ncbi:YibE/F family protein [Actinotalea sp.]|uniref:YibE/F family protein n=1 Tax=Actinotalea sp. TaxID=1872145 RepID=UPI00356510A7